jgi:hypothetical protein
LRTLVAESEDRHRERGRAGAMRVEARFSHALFLGRYAALLDEVV